MLLEVPSPDAVAVRSFVMTLVTVDEPAPAEVFPVRTNPTTRVADDVPTPDPVAVRIRLTSRRTVDVPVPNPVAIRGAV